MIYLDAVITGFPLSREASSRRYIKGLGLPSHLKGTFDAQRFSGSTYPRGRVRPPDKATAAPGANRHGGGKEKTLERPRDTPPTRLAQPPNAATAQVCEHCRRALPKRRRGSPGPAKRFCSATCQKASAREKAAFEAVGYNLSRCPRIASKSVSNSNGCKVQNGHPYPSRFSVPLDVLGRGHRWPGAPKLERRIWEAILWREGCAQ